MSGPFREMNGSFREKNGSFREMSDSLGQMSGAFRHGFYTARAARRAFSAVRI
jgi:hypothetical protein